MRGHSRGWPEWQPTANPRSECFSNIYIYIYALPLDVAKLIKVYTAGRLRLDW